jgi:hypothetical protein
VVVAHEGTDGGALVTRQRRLLRIAERQSTQYLGLNTEYFADCAANLEARSADDITAASGTARRAHSRTYASRP